MSVTSVGYRVYSKLFWVPDNICHLVQKHRKYYHMDDRDEFCLLSSSKVEEQKTTLGSFLEEASIYRYMDFYLISDRYPKNLTSPTRFCTKHNKIGSYKSYYNLNITSCNINFTFKLFYIFSSRCRVVGAKNGKIFQ